MAEVESLCDRIAILSSGHISFFRDGSWIDGKNKQALRIHIKTSKGRRMPGNGKYRVGSAGGAGGIQEEGNRSDGYKNRQRDIGTAFYGNCKGGQ